MSTKKYEKLDTAEEKLFRDGICPDCRVQTLAMGPCGGLSINYACMQPKCGSRFNDMGPFGVDRNTDPSPDKPKEMNGEGPYRS